MKYIIEIEQIITMPMVVDAQSTREARALASQALQSTADTNPEAVGDPVAGASRIRSIRKLGV
ncbi:hypothetical protein [uncultured Microbulbifer sp.]|uniref:hypothetical protein n=1 Tax=uncultured Microbulbifer sp. TaxID=348147 RepID=UPI002615F212|nr:hypothetical protein [uncultured Microbulbifer sp.]